MKRVTLIRHAEAANAQDKIQDVNRPLINAGIIGTRKIIRYLVNNNVTFDCIFTSHAARAKETAKLIATGLQYPQDKIVIINSHYQNDVSVYFDMLYGIDDNVNNIAIVGHNPTITDFTNKFLSKKIFPMLPSTAICIEFSADSWTEIDLAPNNLLFHVYPEML